LSERLRAFDRVFLFVDSGVVADEREAKSTSFFGVVAHPRRRSVLDAAAGSLKLDGPLIVDRPNLIEVKEIIGVWKNQRSID
jgi:hypothetical protein